MTSFETGDHVNDRKTCFLELLDPHLDSLSRFARALTRDQETARDLIGETILEAYERFASLRDASAFLAFIFTIAHRTWKRGVRRRNLFGHYDEGRASEIPSSNPLPDASADTHFLYDALARLPDAQREAVILFEISGLSLEEIRVVQGGTLSGVKARLVRGRRKLAVLLDDSEYPVDSGARSSEVGINSVHTNR